MIGLDLGSKRIGVSICDEKQSIATPFKTINKTNNDELITKYKQRKNDLERRIKILEKSIATPFKTINKTNNNDLINELKKIIEENNIKGIIIGYPINVDGSLGPSAQSVSDVSKNIDQNVGVDVCLWDERLSTVGAFNLSSQLDVNVSKREKNIDQNAAAFILQGAIDYLNN